MNNLVLTTSKRVAFRNFTHPVMVRLSCLDVSIEQTGVAGFTGGLFCARVTQKKKQFTP